MSSKETKYPCIYLLFSFHHWITKSSSKTFKDHVISTQLQLSLSGVQLLLTLEQINLPNIENPQSFWKHLNWFNIPIIPISKSQTSLDPIHGPFLFTLTEPDPLASLETQGLHKGQASHQVGNNPWKCIRDTPLKKAGKKSWKHVWKQ